MANEFRVYYTTGGIGYSLPPGMYLKYLALMKQFFGNGFDLSEGEFYELVRTPSERLIFVVNERGVLVSTAQATRSLAPPAGRIYVNNVVADKDQRKQGWGTIVLGELERLVADTWRRQDRPLLLELTNSPRKENAEFYAKNGWRSRGPDSNDPTVVWTKYV